MSIIESLDDPRLEIAAMKIRLMLVEGGIATLQLVVHAGLYALIHSRSDHRQGPDMLSF